MDKKNNTIIIVILVIILVILAFISLKNRNQKVEPIPTNQTEVDINKAIESDTTLEISAGLDNIDLTDSTDEDLKSVDEELGNL